MLKILVPAGEFWDENTQEFVYTPETVLQLEHSLVSISKWEAKYKKPFIVFDESQSNLTPESILEYIRDMTITQNVNPLVYYALNESLVKTIVDYIHDQQTATWFGNNKPQAGKRDTRPLTSERIYYLMINYNIPFECQKWHLSRLLTLIRVCQEEQKQQEKKSPKDAAMQRHNLNAARRAKSAAHRHH